VNNTVITHINWNTIFGLFVEKLAQTEQLDV